MGETNLLQKTSAPLDSLPPPLQYWQYFSVTAKMSRSTEELLVTVSQYTRPRTHPRSLGACQPGTRAAGPFVSFSGFTSDGGASFSLTHTAHAHTHTHKRNKAESWRGGAVAGAGGAPGV